jgi:FkbM family methyltransferase
MVLMMRRLIHLFEHILRGTLIDRLRWGWGERVKRRRRLWWESHKGRLESFELKIENGIRLRLHLESELARLIYCEYFELMEREFLKAFLRPGDIFVDVGANIGLYTLIAASFVGESGSVYSFEPSEKTFKRLCDNVTLNAFSNVQCYQMALSDEIGEFPFYTSEDGYDAWNSFVTPIAGKAFSKEGIRCQKSDDFALEHDLIDRATMIKIDVEGWESRVLEGARGSLSREDAPLLQVEFTEEASASAGYSCEHLYHLLEELGYKMFVYDHHKRDIVPDPLRASYPYINLLATKNPDRVRGRLRKTNPFKHLF